MTFVTDEIEDVASIPDFTPWFFRSPFRESYDGESIISGEGERVIPRDDNSRAVLGVDLDPGFCFVTYRGKSTLITVPDSSVDVPLYELLEDGEPQQDPKKYTLMLQGSDAYIVGGELDSNGDLVLWNNNGSKTEPLQAPVPSTWVVDNFDGTATIA